tara:strand:- start:83 stop:814 length:732 start_codon:yes stop_codon:yes gene_type:complete
MKNQKFLVHISLTLLLISSCVQEHIINDVSFGEENLIEEEHYLNYSIGDGPFVNFEDVTFKKILLSDFEINTNKDNEISIQEATLFDGNIDVSRKGIWSLVGIENFVNIESLNCDNNSIKTLDLTKNIHLTSLGCGNNPFNKIDLTKNSNIKHLDIRTTNLVTLDLSKNINLITVRAMCNNKLKFVNVKNNYNTNILIFFFDYLNDNLECVQVDNVNFSESTTNWFIGSKATYSLDCSYGSRN